MKPDRPLVDAAGTRYADRSLKEQHARQLREYARKLLEYQRAQLANKTAAAVAGSPAGNLVTGNQAIGLSGLLQGMEPVNKVTPTELGAQAGQALGRLDDEKFIKDYLDRNALTTTAKEPDRRITGPLHTAPDPRFALPGGVTTPDNFKFSQGMAFPELDVSYRTGGGNPQVNPIEAYIRQAAQARGIDPDVAVRVASSEGGLNDPFRQGDAMLSYGREQSYGPFQLHIRGGGVGERAIKAGIDPRKDWQGGVDYALNEAAQKGWGQWFGAAHAGVGNRTGIDGAHTAPVANPLSPGAQDFVLNNPQPGGFGPGVSDPNNPSIFGSMSPGGGMVAQNNSIDPNVAAYAFDDQKKEGWLSKAGKGFDAAMSEVKPPKIAAMPSPSGDVANGLSKLMQNPQALMQMLLQKRLA